MVIALGPWQTTPNLPPKQIGCSFRVPSNQRKDTLSQNEGPLQAFGWFISFCFCESVQTGARNLEMSDPLQKEAHRVGLFEPRPIPGDSLTNPLNKSSATRQVRASNDSHDSVAQKNCNHLATGRPGMLFLGELFWAQWKEPQDGNEISN